MLAPASTPRYSLEDLDTASVYSAAPSYVSEVPSYHSIAPHVDVTPSYFAATPRAAQSAVPIEAERSHSTRSRPQTRGLPPLPQLPRHQNVNLLSFRTPTWSTVNAPAARQYRNVAERRVVNGRYNSTESTRRLVQSATVSSHEQQEKRNNTVIRPLEDPYLVGEAAAAEARRDRIARERRDDVLIREDKHWDWLLATMKDWDERSRGWNRLHRDIESRSRQGLFGRGASDREVSIW